jgi:LysR family glycine cleavage system transcriptional activator
MSIRILETFQEHTQYVRLLMKANRRNLPLNALRVFESVGKHQHLGKAGKELGITASAVSQQIKKLEDLLECELIVRDKTGTRLTSQGVRLLASITRSLDRLTYATQHLHSSREHAILNIACYSGFYKHWLIPRFSGFLESYPNYDVNIYRLDENVDNLTQDVDLAILINSVPDGPDTLKNRDALKIDAEYVPTCTPEYLDKAKPIEKPEDLLQHCLIHFDSGEYWGEWLSISGISPVFTQQNIYLHGCYERAYDAVLNHLGIGLINRLWLSEAFDTGRLVIPVEFPKQIYYAYYLHVTENNYKSPATQHFIEWMYDQQK